MSIMMVQHNAEAMFENRELKVTTGLKAKSSERLASGYRINRAADDAAGLSISEKLRWQVRGLDKASTNIQDGISFLQTGEGALNEVHDMLDRIKELSIQAANDTNTDIDRAAINEEVQQIKKEMQRIFNDTEFNTKKIFRAPYVPNIDNEPQDIQFFNVGDSSTMGGVTINNKRFTWGELGISAWSTPSDEDREITFYDATKDKYGAAAEEKITLKLKAGETLPNVHRVYEIDADNVGIKVNEVYAGKWGVDITEDGETISFEHHGMDISFDIDEGDDKDSIIDRIHGDDMVKITWDALPSGTDGHAAIHTGADVMQMYVTNANSVKVNEKESDIERWIYTVTADNEGVTVKQGNYTVSDGVSHKKMKWEDFSNTDSGEPAWPIVDYGTSNDNPVTVATAGNQRPLNDNPVSLDADATYNYSDVSDPKVKNVLSYNFSFGHDEVSKAEVLSGIDQTLTGYSISAPISSVTAVSSGTTNATASAGNISYHFQRDQLKRDFGGDTGGTDPMDIRIERSEKIDNADEKFVVYEDRKVLTTAYQGWNKQTDVKQYQRTGIKVDNGDGTYTINWNDDTTQFGSTSTSNTMVYENHTGQSTSKASNTTGAAGEAGNTLTEQVVNAGEENEQIIVTETWTETAVSYSYQGVFSHDTGSYVRVGDNSTQTYVRPTSYDGDDETLVRDADRYVITDGASASVGEQRYLDTGRTQRVDNYTYDSSYYTYTVYNKDGGQIMTGRSSRFIDTGSGPDSDPNSVKDSNGDYQHDLAMISAGNSVTRTTQGMVAKNVTGEMTLYSTKEGRNVTVSTDLSNQRIVNMTGTDVYGRTNTIYVTFNDSSNTTGNVNKTTNFKVNPDGRAYRQFYKSEKNGGHTTETNFKTKVNAPEKTLMIQAGALGLQGIEINWTALSNSIIGMGSVATTTAGLAQAAIGSTDEAIDYISTIRSGFGAQQNRLEHAYAIDRIIQENTDTAESRIRDTDMARETVIYSKYRLLEQVGQTLLAQANQNKMGILNLLQ